MFIQYDKTDKVAQPSSIIFVFVCTVLSLTENVLLIGWLHHTAEYWNVSSGGGFMLWCNTSNYLKGDCFIVISISFIYLGNELFRNGSFLPNVPKFNKWLLKRYFWTENRTPAVWVKVCCFETTKWKETLNDTWF